MQLARPQDSSLPVLKLFFAGFLLVLLAKVFFATVLDLYSDEVFYWLASNNPALAYSDLPFMTALLIGLGSSLDPGSTFAARLLFITLGSCLPFLVYWIAKPVSSPKQAVESAALSLCLPLGGFLGLLAVPDVPLIFFGLLSIGFFERALREDKIFHWLGTGVFVALGLCTHYRFFAYPAAAVIFLCWYEPQRWQWRNSKFWMAAGIASLGFIPVIWFNFAHQLSSASFYFIERHPWEFHASGLLHVFKQAGLVTPPLYAAFAITLYYMFQQARNRNCFAAFALTLSLINIVTYMILAPWTDATSTSIHWPLSGYFPLLVFLPQSLGMIYIWISARLSAKHAYFLVAAIPAIGFTGTLVAFVGVGSQAYQEELQALLGQGVLSNKMAGWREFSSTTSKVLASEFEGSPAIIVTDNYYTAAQVEFAGISNEVYTYDRKKAVRDGRIFQYQLWQKDEIGFLLNQGRKALFITEDSTLDALEIHALLSRLCPHVDHMEKVSELSLYGGDKFFSFYKAKEINSTDDSSYPCPYPSRAWIDYPEANAELTADFELRGWAYNEDIGIQAVRVLVDGESIGSVDYGTNRQDVVDVMQERTDPAIPNLGFSLSIDSTTLSTGPHQLELEIENRLGILSLYGERTIHIVN